MGIEVVFTEEVWLTGATPALRFVTYFASEGGLTESAAASM